MRMRSRSRSNSRVEGAPGQTIIEQARKFAKNQDAIDYYNAFVEKHGVFGEEFRNF
jgi:hypothetical protein